MTMLPMMGGGMFGGLARLANPPLVQPEEQQGGGLLSGLFGGGKPNWKNAAIGALSGYMAARGNPIGGMGLQYLMQQRGQKREDEQYQQRRKDALLDYAEKQKIEAQYQQPRVNDTVADYDFRVEKLGREAADDWLRNPAQYVNIPGVGLVQMPRVGAPAPQQNAKPVGKLTPIEDDGGPSPLGSGGFRFPF